MWVLPKCWERMLVCLLRMELAGVGVRSLTQLSKKINTTYAHGASVIKNLEEKKLVKTRRDSLCRVAHLTDNGRTVAGLLIKIEKLLESP